MRTIHTDAITKAVARLCMDANYDLNHDIEAALAAFCHDEPSPNGREILQDILANAKLARECAMPICQDTGMAVFRIEVGQDVHIEGGGLTDAINEGVRQGYKEGYLRKSVVGDPLRRVNTKDNTPAIIHYDIVPGDKLHIVFAPKGFGSENMSALRMLKPAQGLDGVIDFVVETADKAGSNPCPPMVVGVGIGGTMEKAAQMAKFALLRPIDEKNPDPYYAELEDTLLRRINQLGTGPQGLGGRTTAIGVNVEVFATHIAGLPVAVNINCHATRHKEVTL